MSSRQGKAVHSETLYKKENKEEEVEEKQQEEKLGRVAKPESQILAVLEAESCQLQIQGLLGCRVNPRPVWAI